MIVESKHGQCYVNQDSIDSMYIQRHSEEFIELVIVSKGNEHTQMEVSSISEAELIIEKISKAKGDTAGKTYLDGFREGTEYAIKLIKETK